MSPRSQGPQTAPVDRNEPLEPAENRVGSPTVSLVPYRSSEIGCAGVADTGRKSRPSGKPGRSGPPGNKNAQKHGLFGLQRDLAARGPCGLDGEEGQNARGLRRKLYRHLGGAKKLGPVGKLQVDRLVQMGTKVNRVGRYLDGIPHLVNRRSRALIPALLQWCQLLAAERTLAQDLEARRPTGDGDLAQMLDEAWRRTTIDKFTREVERAAAAQNQSLPVDVATNSSPVGGR